MRFFRITRHSLPRWQPQLEALERLAVYPLGRDAFRISHGRDYFAFFERMGQVAYYALAEGRELAAVGCGILREGDSRLPRRWYVSDVKVHPRFRGRHLMLSMIYRAFWQNYLRCPRGYAVAMDPPDGRVPPALRTFAHFRWLPARTLRFSRLDIYSADEAGVRRALPLLPGSPRFLSLLGVKDLILESTKAPLPLLHLSFSRRPAPRVFADPQPGHVHMWCLPRDHPGSERLRAAGFPPSATATVIHHRLGDFDGAAIETAEI